jgi:flagellar biosynthetic protein FliO
MRAFILSLTTMTLFLIPVYGQIVQLPFSEEMENEGGNYTAFDSQAMADPGVDKLAEEPDLPIFKAVGGLGLVLCLIVGGFFGLKKIAPQYFARHTSGKSLKVVETLSMGDRRSISLIQVADSHFLIGNTPQQINFLAMLPEPLSSNSDPAAAATTAPAAAREPFKSGDTSFRGLFEVEKKRRPATPLPNDVRAKMRQLREALEQ